RRGVDHEQLGARGHALDCRLRKGQEFGLFTVTRTVDCAAQELMGLLDGFREHGVVTTKATTVPDDRAPRLLCRERYGSRSGKRTAEHGKHRQLSVWPGALQ